MNPAENQFSLNRQASRHQLPAVAHNRLRILVSGILLAVSACGQTPDQLGQSVVYLEMEHPVYEDVGTNHFEVWYHHPGGTSFFQKATRNSGTGFFVYYHARTYIVTAKHVVGGPTNFGTVFLIQPNGVRQPLEVRDIRSMMPGARWFLHPKADVAVHPYGRPNAMVVANRDIPEAWISTNQLELLSPVCALGFPVSLGTVGEKISPIATKCETSSWLTMVPDENPELNFILLGKALAQGYSGAPIFTLQQPFKGGTLSLVDFHSSVIGICKAQRADNFGGKHAIIVPASYILEVFQQRDFLDYERQSAATPK